MESKSTFFILIVIVAVLALSLAALAGYLLIVQEAPEAEKKASRTPSERITAIRQKRFRKRRIS